ncbi:MAG: biotin/lipoyl-binding protein [Rhodospirillaceae bacterium]|nr:biotin/lipoyl-binding protein [Rhodospirillaceae bacterium]
MTAFRPALLFAALAALAGCDRPSQDSWLGYVEAEYTYVAPLEAGRIIALDVERGDQVEAGQPLFTLESDAEQAARDQAAAELAQAESDLIDLQKGDRPEDLAIIQAQLDKAQASLALSVPRLQRREKMVKGSIIGEEELDEAKSQILADRGNIAEYEARLTEGRLPARIDKIVAAEKLVEALKHPNMTWRLHAQRLLVDRGNADVVPALTKLLEDKTVDETGLNAGAVHALRTLQGIGALDRKNAPLVKAVDAALAHPHRQRPGCSV